MKNRLGSFILCSIVVLFCATVGLSKTKQFIVFFDFPLADNTQATAINPSGVIVGRYFPPDTHHHGFVLKNGAFTSVDVGSISTDAAWINASGAIVGSYQNSDGKLHAYVSSGGAITTIDFSADPNVNTTGYGISDAGDVVGVGFVDGDFFHGQGYVFSHGQLTVIKFPDASGTLPTMVLGPNRIVGNYVDADNVGHGFLLSHGVRTTIDVPNSTFTWITGINPEGHIVGFYYGQDGKQHAFLLKSGRFITIHIPGSTGSQEVANGIDPQDDVVGFFSTADGRVRSYFLLNPTMGSD